MKILIASIVFLLALFSDYSWGQKFSPVFENITDGLPSTEVHDMFQDSIGFMWFATDRGICRYDGERMKIIERTNNGSTNVFFKFFKQSNKKIWVLNGDMQFFWFNPTAKNTVFHPFEKNQLLRREVHKYSKVANVSKVLFTRKGMIITFRRDLGYLEINETSCKWHLFNNPITEIYPKKFHFKISKKLGLYFLKLDSFWKKDGKKHTVVYDNETYFLDNDSKILVHNDLGVTDFAKTSFGEYVAVTDVLFRKYKGKVTSTKLPSRVLRVVPYKNKLIVGTFEGVYELDRNMRVVGHYLEKHLITNLFIDKEKNLWISTYDSGVFKYNKKQENVRQYKLPLGPIYIFGFERGLVLLEKLSRKGYVIQENSQLLGTVEYTFVKEGRIKTESKELIHLLQKIDHFSAFSFENNYSINNQTHQFLPDWYFKSTSFYAEEGRLYQNINNIFYEFVVFKNDNKVKICFQNKKKELIIGSDHGLYRMKISAKQVDKMPIGQSKNVCFTDHSTFKNYHLLCSRNGLFQFQNDQLEHVKGSENIQLNGIVNVKDSIALVYSDSKLFQIQEKNGNLAFEEYKLILGNESPFIISLASLKNEIWVSTKTGVYVHEFSNKELRTDNAPFRFIVDSVVLNNSAQKNENDIIAYSGSNFQLFFSTICFDKRLPRNLEYSLDGEKWFETNKNNVVLSNMTAGNYLLRIRRMDKPNHLLYSMPVVIKNKFFQTIWFQVLMFLLIGAFFFGYIRKMYSDREKKRKIETEKLALELQLLTSKMNPHFTFNTINSIQQYILNSEKKKALIYLSEFALLMRKSLEFSMEERITIDQEKEFLELYLALENKRFSTDFQLEFEVDSSVNRMEKKIPSMLIQPLVENIVLHANYKLNEPKRIKIQIQLLNGFFHITVRDFGKGITTSNQIRVHKSYGLEIIKSRVKMYNGDDFTEDDFHVYTYNSDEEKGTLVSLRIKEWV